MIYIYIFTILWLIAAALTVKADAMSVNIESDWWNLPWSIVFWPFVAVLICFSKHAVYSEGRDEDREYRY